MEVENQNGHPSKLLPPGFQFDPSDEELILHFLYARASSVDNFHPKFIPDLDICAVDPWGLNGKALLGCNKWYFYSKSNKEVPVRETETGYWKVKEDHVEDEAILIYSSSAAGYGGKKKKMKTKKKKKKVVGWKRFYVFYIGDPPLGIQTSWVLEEYHLLSKNGAHAHRTRHLSADTEGWVLCRVLEVNDCNSGLSFRPAADQADSNEVELSSLDEVFLSLDHQEDDDGETME